LREAGYDLTWPFGTADLLKVLVPEPPKFAGKQFASVEEALADGPSSSRNL
jgi:hypothetical protein